MIYTYNIHFLQSVNSIFVCRIYTIYYLNYILLISIRNFTTHLPPSFPVTLSCSVVALSLNIPKAWANKQSVRTWTVRDSAKEAAGGVAGGKHSRFVENKTLIQTPSLSTSSASSSSLVASSAANPKPKPSVLAVREQQQLRREQFAANWVSFATVLGWQGREEGRWGRGLVAWQSSKSSRGHFRQLLAL